LETSVKRKRATDIRKELGINQADKYFYLLIPVLGFQIFGFKSEKAQEKDRNFAKAIFIYSFFSALL